MKWILDLEHCLIQCSVQWKCLMGQYCQNVRFMKFWLLFLISTENPFNPFAGLNSYIQLGDPFVVEVYSLRNWNIGWWLRPEISAQREQSQKVCLLCKARLGQLWLHSETLSQQLPSKLKTKPDNSKWGVECHGVSQEGKEWIGECR